MEKSNSEDEEEKKEMSCFPCNECKEPLIRADFYLTCNNILCVNYRLIVAVIVPIEEYRELKNDVS